MTILVGGDGEKKTLHTVAKYADAWNTGGTLEFVRHKDAVLRDWCERVSRDHNEIERTMSLGLVIIRDDPADATRYLAEVRSRHPGYDDPARVGTPAEIAACLLPYVKLGFRHLIADIAAPFDLETLERLVGDVKPLLRGAR